MEFRFLMCMSMATRTVFTDNYLHLWFSNSLLSQTRVIFLELICNRLWFTDEMGDRLDICRHLLSLVLPHNLSLRIWFFVVRICWFVFSWLSWFEFECVYLFLFVVATLRFVWHACTWVYSLWGFIWFDYLITWLLVIL